MLPQKICKIWIPEMAFAARHFRENILDDIKYICEWNCKVVQLFLDKSHACQLLEADDFDEDNNTTIRFSETISTNSSR
jgi:hypothetical protein